MRSLLVAYLNNLLSEGNHLIPRQKTNSLVKYMLFEDVKLSLVVHVMMLL
jgi:hypothetical protein